MYTNVASMVPSWRIALLIGLFAVACSAEGSPESAGDEISEDSTPVAGYELLPRDLSKVVQSSGTIEPRERIRIKSHMEGVLTAVNIEEGDEVSRGDVLATSELSELRAQLRRAQAEAAAYRQRYKRRKPLVDSNAVRQDEVDELRSNLEIAESEVALWETRIELSRVTAPRDAVVTSRHVDPGGFVVAGEPIVDLVDVSKLRLPVRLSERDVVRIDTGQPVDVFVDAYPERSLGAVIRRVFPSADADSRRVTVEIELSDIPDDMTVQPGFLARVSLVVDRRRDVLAVPDQSLLASTSEDRFVYLVENDHLVRRDVETGVSRRNWTEIHEGLTAGDIIVGTKPTNLREGTRVHVSEWVEAP